MFLKTQKYVAIYRSILEFLESIRVKGHSLKRSPSDNIKGKTLKSIHIRPLSISVTRGSRPNSNWLHISPDRWWEKPLFMGRWISVDILRWGESPCRPWSRNRSEKNWFTKYLLFDKEVTYGMDGMKIWEAEIQNLSFPVLEVKMGVGIWTFLITLQYLGKIYNSD